MNYKVLLYPIILLCAFISLQGQSPEEWNQLIPTQMSNQNPELESRPTGEYGICGADEEDNLLFGERVDIGENNNWIPLDSARYAYDLENKRIETIDLNYVAAVWRDTVETIYSYENDILAEVILSIWDGEEWTKYLKAEYNADENDLLLETLLQAWSPTAWDWIDVGRTTFAYNEDGNVTEENRQQWNGSSYFTFALFLSTYNEMGLPDVYTEMELIDGELVNSLQTSYIYDDAGNLLIATDQGWLENWQNTNKREYAYNDLDQRIERIRFNWPENATEWNDWQRTTYEHNEAGFVSNGVIAIDLGEWEDFERWENTYDACDNLVLSSYDQKLSTISDWEKYFRYTYHYGGEPSGLGDKPIQNISVYPNPVSSVLRFNGIVNLSDDAIVNVYNAAGVKLFSGSYYNNVDGIDVELFKNGYYILEIATDQETSRTGFIVSR